MQYSFKKLVMLWSSDILMLTFFTNLQRWRLISLCRSSGKFSKSISSFTPLVAAQLYRSARRTCLQDKPITWVRLPINPASKGNLRMWNPSCACYLQRLQIYDTYRDTHTHTHTDRHRHTTHTYRHRHRHTQTETETDTHTHTHTHTNAPFGLRGRKGE